MSSYSTPGIYVREPIHGGGLGRPTLYQGIRLTHPEILRILERHESLDYNYVRARFDREYRNWSEMNARCRRPRHPSYRYHGARGIQVCFEWQQSFLTFLNYLGPRAPGCNSVDRIKTDGNYEPGNCRWADPAVQNANRRICRHIEFDGQRLTFAEWDKVKGFPRGTVSSRKANGYTDEEALTLARGERRRPRPKKPSVHEQRQKRRRKYSGKLAVPGKLWYTYGELDQLGHLPPGKVYHRITKQKWAIERAVEEPLRGAGKPSIPSELTLPHPDQPWVPITRTLLDWEKPNEYRNDHLPPRTIERRLRDGWPAEEAVTAERYGRRHGNRRNRTATSRMV